MAAVGVDPAGHQAGGDERARLVAMDALQRLAIRLRALRFQIHHLPADHAFDASRSTSDFLDDAHASLGRAGQLGQSLIGGGLQGIAGKNGRGFSERFVAGGLAAPQVVIIQRGQIVVNERIGVQHLQRRAQVFAAGRDFAGDHARRFQAEDRTQPLAAREYAVAHGTVDGFRRPRRRRQQPLQRCIDRVLSRLKHLLNHKVVSITTGVESMR